MNTSILAEELAPLNVRIDEARSRLEGLEDELRAAAAELETYSAERQRFTALREICDGLERLGDLGAADLFWQGIIAGGDGAAHVGRLRERIAHFDEEIRGACELKEALQERVDEVLDELAALNDEVLEAHAREERRRDEFVVVREISPLPLRRLVMPWCGDSESESLFRRSLLVSLLLSLVCGAVIPLVDIPLPERSAVVVEIPERLAMLVKKPPPPAPEPLREEKTAEVEPKKPEEPQKTKKISPEKTQVAKASAQPAGGGKQAARKKAETTGVLAFKSSFADLMDETPVAKLGAEARLNDKARQAPGQARAQRSLVATQAKGGSGGIGGAAVSHNLGVAGGGGGNGRGIEGVGFSRVESAVAGLTEKAGRPVSDGPGPGRTDEEIQIVFDRYKATLYRIYNKELRKDPTLRGKLLLRISIEPGGEISLCKVESTDLHSAELVAQIVARVERFNFGPKEGVPKTTILYPIDFLPAG